MEQKNFNGARPRRGRGEASAIGGGVRGGAGGGAVHQDGFRPPSFWRVSRPPGAAKTPNNNTPPGPHTYMHVSDPPVNFPCVLCRLTSQLPVLSTEKASIQAYVRFLVLPVVYI